MLEDDGFGKREEGGVTRRQFRLGVGGNEGGEKRIGGAEMVKSEVNFGFCGQRFWDFVGNCKGRLRRFGGSVDRDFGGNLSDFVRSEWDFGDC